MSAAASFPQYETKVIKPLGDESAAEGVHGARKAMLMGTCTQHNQNSLPQLNSEIVNLTGMLKTKD